MTCNGSGQMGDQLMRPGLALDLRVDGECELHVSRIDLPRAA